MATQSTASTANIDLAEIHRLLGERDVEVYVLRREVGRLMAELVATKLRLTEKQEVPNALHNGRPVQEPAKESQAPQA